MEEDLFTFTAYIGRNPVFKHQGFPGYTSTTTFRCLCKSSTIDVPHSAIIMHGSIAWQCQMPWDFCGRRYTFRLDYPVHVINANESISDTLVGIENSVALMQRSLRDTQNRVELARRHDPLRDIIIRPEDPIVAIERALRQPDETIQLREDISSAFDRLEERMLDMQEEIQQSLEDLSGRTEDTVRAVRRTFRHVRAVEDTTAGTGDTLQVLQADVGAIGNLGHIIQQINPNDGVAQLQPVLFVINQSIQQLQAALHADVLTDIRHIRDQLRRYNRRYDRSIGVIIG